MSIRGEYIVCSARYISNKLYEMPIGGGMLNTCKNKYEMPVRDKYIACIAKYNINKLYEMPIRREDIVWSAEYMQ